MQFYLTTAMMIAIILGGLAMTANQSYQLYAACCARSLSAPVTPATPKPAPKGQNRNN